MREVVRMANSVFADVETAPPIEVFQLGRDFATDTNPKKVPHPLLETFTSPIGGPERVVVSGVIPGSAMYLQVSLEVGAYRTSEGKPWILPVVKKAEKILAKKVSSLVLRSKQGHSY